MKEGKAMGYLTAVLWLGALSGITSGQFGGGTEGGFGDAGDTDLDITRQLFTNQREDIPDDEVTGEVAQRVGVAACVSSGDPHIFLINGQVVHYQGDCTYTMMRDNCYLGLPLGTAGPSKFHITAQFYRKDPAVAATWTKEATIYLPEKSKTIRLAHDLKVYVDGVVVTNSSHSEDDGDIYIGKILQKVFVVVAPYGLQVNWNGQQLSIVVSDTYAGELCGLCGDVGQFGLIIGPYVGCLPSGLTPGSTTSDHVDYGNSWQVPSPDCECAVPPQPCPDPAAAEAVCAELTNPIGRFSECLAQMLPDVIDGFKESCIFDVCIAGSLAMCDIAEELVEHCQSTLGVRIYVWRDDVFCPADCPPNMHSSSCAAACEPDTCPPNAFGTCLSTDACTERCTCDSGFLWDIESETCVAECPPPVPTDCPTGQDLHCFTCRARTEIGCWLCGHYEKCDSGDICFHETYNKNNNTHHRVRRGCIPEDECYPGGIGNGNYSCLTVEDRCRNCDNHFGHPTPSQPKRPRSRCKPADYGICYCKGDPHCESYDGYYFENMNVGCWHVLTRDNCVNGQINDDAQFAVHIKIEKLTGPKKINKWAVSAVKIVHLDQILIVTRQKGFYTFNGTAGQFVSGSNSISSAPNIAVDFNPSYWTMRVYVNGFQVSWDFSRAVSVWAPDNKNGTLCGICGDFNGDKDTGDNVYGPSTGDGQCAAVTDLNVTAGDTATSDERLGLSWYNKHSGDVDCDATCAISA